MNEIVLVQFSSYEVGILAFGVFGFFLVFIGLLPVKRADVEHGTR